MQSVRRRRKKEGGKEGKEEEKRRKEEKDQRKKGQRKNERESGQTAGAHFFFLDGMSVPFSPQPLVHEAGERDHVGPFVSRFPISVCTPADHDEVELRSSSTKDGTLCPRTIWWITRRISRVWLKDADGCIWIRC